MTDKAKLPGGLEAKRVANLVEAAQSMTGHCSLGEKCSRFGQKPETEMVILDSTDGLRIGVELCTDDKLIVLAQLEKVLGPTRYAFTGKLPEALAYDDARKRRN